jgi:hypothetical protein
MIRVYTASKLSTAPLWRTLDAEWPCVFFHARWLKHNVIGTPDDAEFAARFWVEDHEDVATADAVMLYAETGQHLRGALVEAGIALALKIPVVIVGDHPDYGTWRYHPGCIRVASLEDAYDLFDNWHNR